MVVASLASCPGALKFSKDDVHGRKYCGSEASTAAPSSAGGTGSGAACGSPSAPKLSAKTLSLRARAATVNSLGSKRSITQSTSPRRSQSGGLGFAIADGEAQKDCSESPKILSLRARAAEVNNLVNKRSITQEISPSSSQSKEVARAAGVNCERDSTTIETCSAPVIGDETVDECRYDVYPQTFQAGLEPTFVGKRSDGFDYIVNVHADDPFHQGEEQAIMEDRQIQATESDCKSEADASEQAPVLTRQTPWRRLTAMFDRCVQWLGHWASDEGHEMDAETLAAMSPLLELARHRRIVLPPGVATATIAELGADVH